MPTAPQTVHRLPSRLVLSIGGRRTGLLILFFFSSLSLHGATGGSVSGTVADRSGAVVAGAILQLVNTAQQTTHQATSDKAYPPQLSGTVVDTSGAVIAGATVQVRSADGTVQRTTQSDRNGSFIISGLPAGNYRLVVSNPDFETKEMPVTIGTTGASGPAAHLSGCGRREHHHKRAGPGG